MHIHVQSPLSTTSYLILSIHQMYYLYLKPSITPFMRPMKLVRTPTLIMARYGKFDLA